MPTSSNRVSPRAAKFWARLGSWYGAGVIAQSYGDTPPADWAEVIDHHGNESIRLALTEVRSEHTRYPPTLPEFEKILRKVSSPKLTSRGPRPQDVLTAHVLRNVRLTPSQLRGPWTFFGHEFSAKNCRGELIENHGHDIVGVLIDADGDAPSHRVLLADVQAQQLAHEFDVAAASQTQPIQDLARHLPELPDFGPREAR